MTKLKEIWKDIPYLPHHKISNFCRLKRIARIVNYVDGRIRHDKEKIMKQYLSISGYFVANLSKDKTLKTHFIHKLIATAFIPNPENKKEVNHINGIKHDNRFENLEWVTPSENCLHAVRTGLKKITRGEERPHKLSEIQVRQIRAIKNKTSREIALEFNVSHSTVQNIRSYKKWTHI